MSNTNITNGQLLRWHDELKQLQSINSIFFQFNRSKINEFYRQNGIRIDSVFKKMDVLRREFFLIENDKLVMEGEEGKQEPVLLPEKKREDFNAKYQEILEGQVSIIL